MRKIAIVLLLALLPSAAASAEHSAVTIGRYTLQSNVWVNLHQRLLYEARFNAPAAPALKEGNLEKWTNAMQTYKKYFGRRSPIVDDELISINSALSKTDGNAKPKNIPEPIAGTLRSIMPTT